MKNNRLVIAAFTLILSANIIVLVKVSYNRSQISQQITLTEREVYQRYRRVEENSATSLQIQWQTPPDEDYGYYSHNRYLRLSDTTLSKLGLKKSCNDDNRHHKIQREAWILLQQNGLAYQTHLQQILAKIELQRQTINAQETRDKKSLKTLNDKAYKAKNKRSRLYAIAVAGNKESLSAAYPEQENTLIVKGLISKTNHCNNKIRINELYLNPLHISQEVLKESVKKNGNQVLPHHYDLNIAVGALNEAWVQSIQTRNQNE
ncbi:MAG: DUF4824 family protein [Pseudomonadales bacterium]|nr:DUF4824 family protein [Pseudomonadales bacterium]